MIMNFSSRNSFILHKWFGMKSPFHIKISGTQTMEPEQNWGQSGDPAGSLWDRKGAHLCQMKYGWMPLHKRRVLLCGWCPSNTNLPGKLSCRTERLLLLQAEMPAFSLIPCSGMKLKVTGKRQRQTKTSLGAFPFPGHPKAPAPAYKGLVSPGIREQEFPGICSLLVQLCTFISPDKYSSNLYIIIFHNLPADSDLNPVMQMNLSRFCPIHNGFGSKAICVNQLFSG